MRSNTLIDLGGPTGGRWWRVTSDHTADHPDAQSAAVHARVTGSVGATYNDVTVARSDAPEGLEEQELTLASAAESREAARQAHEDAKAVVAALKPKWDAANAAVGKTRNDLARVDLAMASAKRAHLVVAAMVDLGIPTQEPPLVVVPTEGANSLPPVWQLTALSADGTVGLYTHRRGRRGGKMYSIRATHVPEAVEAKRLERHAAQQDSFTLSKRFGGYSTPEYKAAADASKAELKRLFTELCELVGAHVDQIGLRHDSDLYAWESRGRGEYGSGSGSLKPLPSPTGGTWRWLKVKEQAELAEVA